MCRIKMGKRSINITKSGKYMNPTDKTRKQARKQELKKNKKQRQMVRAAVLKGKDPQQILEEMEKIDEMEYNVIQPSPLNEKVLKDKRKKLGNTLERVFSMYQKDDPEKWTVLKRRQSDYEHKRNQLVTFNESVKRAQQVKVDEIPLPQLPQQNNALPNALEQIPPPGLPPRLLLRMPQVAPSGKSVKAEATPQLTNRSELSTQGATISAKPQIRNLSADVTRFVPSALRVKREDKKPMKNPSAFVREMKQKEINMHQNALAGRTKDDAYKLFMQEMEQLM